jgi:ketosteroid isomerase-like protein
MMNDELRKIRVHSRLSAPEKLLKCVYLKLYKLMKKLLFLAFIALASLNVIGQTAAGNLQKIYDTEKAFEKAAAERGMNQAFLEFSAPDGICFFPGYPTNCIEFFRAAKPTPAALLWNPTFIDVSSNGAIGYSTGNSTYKPKGKDDPTAYYGEYASVWQRQADGSYKAVVDLGISHAAPNTETKWTSPADTGKELNEKRFNAADSANAFFQMAETQGLHRAYKEYFADDVRILRDGKMPFVGKQNALAEIKTDKRLIRFARVSVFSGAADMAYLMHAYTRIDKSGKELEKGNFLQVWKLRGNKWQIVFDIFLPVAPA